MIEDDAGTVRTVAWLELFPWLRLFRCFHLAISGQALLVSTAALVATLGGWALLTAVFSDGEEAIAWLGVTELVPNEPSLFGSSESAGGDSLFQRSSNPMIGTWDHLSRPFRQLVPLGRRAPAEELTWGRWFFYLLAGLWGLVVWSFCGGMLTRMAAVRLATDERSALLATAHFVRARWPSYLAAPLLMLIVVMLASIGFALVGLLLRLDLTTPIAAILWPILLIVSAGLVLALFVLLFAWPLMFAAISAEKATDCFDAMGRSFDYVHRRPLHYLFYACVAAALGSLGWILVSNFAAATISLTYSFAEVGAGRQRVELVRGHEEPDDQPGAGESQEPSGDADEETTDDNEDEMGFLGRCGAGMIRCSCGCVKLIAVAFLYSYFWTASTAMFLLLRHDADDTELDEVYLEDDEQDDVPEPLPPLDTDEAGAPSVVGDDA